MPSKEWHISGVPKAKAFGSAINVNSVTYRLIKEFMAGHHTGGVKMKFERFRGSLRA
ncbi:hypothetical protein [Parabacteroides bouchesdurhonensis]|uniref:hypothetical protein n=1 Tax=Parabacteroides bouchesdurhonensis TaxID=1936995 RepID=UPI0022E77D63|nr:hypothetical protein [Parabacteroides bouchesdurhonensis]